MALSLQSTVYGHGEAIPRRYTCDGENVSPPLQWSGVPQGARSLVLIIDDPDAPDPKAPRMTWVHWLLINIPPHAVGLPEAVAERDLPAGTRVGFNSGKRKGYSGPRPPLGRHRYFHKLYALDTILDTAAAPNVDEVKRAMEGHVLASAEFFATYAHES